MLPRQEGKIAAPHEGRQCRPSTILWTKDQILRGGRMIVPALKGNDYGRCSNCGGPKTWRSGWCRTCAANKREEKRRAGRMERPLSGPLLERARTTHRTVPAEGIMPQADTTTYHFLMMRSSMPSGAGDALLYIPQRISEEDIGFLEE